MVRIRGGESTLSLCFLASAAGAGLRRSTARTWEECQAECLPSSSPKRCMIQGCLRKLRVCVDVDCLRGWETHHLVLYRARRWTRCAQLTARCWWGRWMVRRVSNGKGGVRNLGVNFELWTKHGPALCSHYEFFSQLIISGDV